MRILWLASWYPNQLEQFTGDFIQRHAQASGLYSNIQVIHVVRDTTGEVTKNVLVKEFKDGNLNEMIIYYYCREVIPGFPDKYFSFLKFKRVFKKAILRYIHKEGKPDLIHVHTGMKAGLLAMWVKRKFKIPYIVSEHWTGFLPEASDNFADLPGVIKKNWKKLIRGASGVSVVSSYLADKLSMSIRGQFPLVVIPNVVNTSVFFPDPQQKAGLAKFVHVSELNFQKDPDSILQAFAIVKNSGASFCLDIFGTPRNEVKAIVNNLGLSDEVQFHGEVPQTELSRYFQQADALILYSRYETFGCVIIEANACGLPVIVSDIPVLNEIVKEGENGVLVRGNDPQALAEKLLFFIKGKVKFDPDNIAATASKKYNYKEIGKRFYEWYKSVLKNTEQ
jgi:glycosyltransferase involved in cell wall biosynthesis